MNPPLIRFHRLARQEYLSARRWYARQGSENVAQSFTDEVDRALTRIAAQPENWPVYYGNYRWVRVRRFPYLLVYRIIDDSEVLIVAVAHTSRRPGYWRRRKDEG